MQNYFGYNICCMCVFSQRKANILLLSSCCNQIRFCQNIFTASHSSCTVAPCFFEQASCGHLQKHRWKKKCTFAVYYKLYDSWVLILNIIDIAKSSRIYFQWVTRICSYVVPSAISYNYLHGSVQALNHCKSDETDE